MSDAVVYIAKAFRDGECIRRIVHVNKADARDDINTIRRSMNADEVIVEPERLYLGRSNEFSVTTE